MFLIERSLFYIGPQHLPNIISYGWRGPGKHCTQCDNARDTFLPRRRCLIEYCFDQNLSKLFASVVGQELDQETGLCRVHLDDFLVKAILDHIRQ